MKAIDNFDVDLYDVRFSTYGVPMIAGEVRRFLRDSSAVRVSRSMRDTAYRVLKVREEFMRTQMTRAHGGGDRQGAGTEAGGCGVCNGRHLRSGLPLRPGLFRARARHRLRHGSGAG